MNFSPELIALARSMDNIDTSGAIWDEGQDWAVGLLAAAAQQILDGLAEQGWKVVRTDD